MYKLVIFDLDGTLLDSAGAILEAINITFAELGLGPYRWESDIVRFFGTPFRQWTETLLKEGDKYSEANVERMVNIMYDNYAVIGPKHAKLNPGALETLESLRKKGVRLAVATNMILRHKLAFFSHFRLDRYFEKVCTISDVKRGKPFPDEFICIAKAMPAEKGEVLMVGDSVADVEFARNCGIRVALLDAPWNRKLKPDYRVERLDRILKIA